MSVSARTSRAALVGGVVVVAAVAAAVAAALVGGDDGAPSAAGELRWRQESSAGADDPSARSARPSPATTTSAVPVRRPGEPRWQVVPSVTEPVDPARPGLGEVDVYVPRAGVDGVSRGRLPVVVLLGQRDVHHSQYEQLAHEVASYGAVVLVPERLHGRRAVRAARAWAARAPRARPDRLGVIAVGRVELEAARRAGGVDLWAAYLPADDPAGSPVPGLGARPALVVTGGSVEVGGRDVVRVHRPGAIALAVTDEGSRGPTGDEPVRGERLDQIAAVGRWFGTWVAAHDRDRLSREFLADRLASPGRDPDGTTVSATGRLPW